MEDSQFVPNPLFQCNYFYASRELLLMTATTAGGGGGGVETRRNVARRDGDIACVGPAERRHWFHRGETRDGKWSWVVPAHLARASCSSRDRRQKRKTRRMGKGRRAGA